VANDATGAVISGLFIFSTRLPDGNKHRRQRALGRFDTGKRRDSLWDGRFWRPLWIWHRVLPQQLRVFETLNSNRQSYEHHDCFRVDSTSQAFVSTSRHLNIRQSRLDEYWQHNRRNKPFRYGTGFNRVCFQSYVSPGPLAVKGASGATSPRSRRLRPICERNLSLPRSHHRFGRELGMCPERRHC